MKIVLGENFRKKYLTNRSDTDIMSETRTFCEQRSVLFVVTFPYDEIGRDCYGTAPKGMQKLSGKRTGFGRNSGEPQGTEEAIRQSENPSGQRQRHRQAQKVSACTSVFCCRDEDNGHHVWLTGHLATANQNWVHRTITN